MCVSVSLSLSLSVDWFHRFEVKEAKHDKAIVDAAAMQGVPPRKAKQVCDSCYNFAAAEMDERHMAAQREQAAAEESL